MDGGVKDGTTPAHVAPFASDRAVAVLSRRGVLHAGLAASVTLLGGCGLRLDLPQPPPPTPTRQQVPDEAFLVSFVRDLRDLGALGRGLPKAERQRGVVRDALRVLADQDEVLTGRLTNAGVPTAVIDAGPTAAGASPTTVPRPTTSSPPSGSTPFAAAVGTLPEGRWEALARATVLNRPILLSATSARLAAAIRLGRTISLPGAEDTSLHTTLALHTAALVYGFEVVAAQSVGADRVTALGTLDQLRRLLDEVGSDLPGSALPGGWSLPYPVTTPADAGRLAQDLLAHAIDATTSLLPPTPSAAGAAELATWSARVQALGPAHSIPLAAFPGTSGAARS